MPPTTPAKTFSVSPSKLKLGDTELQLPKGKIKVDWNLKTPKMTVESDGEKLSWILSEVSQIVFVTTPGEEVCMRLHLDTDTPEAKGGGGGGPLVAAGALRRGWKVVYLQRREADKARASINSWRAEKAPDLEVIDSEGSSRLELGSPLTPASPAPSTPSTPSTPALVAAGLAATVRLGIAVPGTTQASRTRPCLPSARLLLSRMPTPHPA
eukprot:Transcript_7644.p2 GENE.Transcript_7644~~Transcript_7644.p2  ORF type:complete len:211 (+),score=67.64 Transcript_7644:172-804(+)